MQLGVYHLSTYDYGEVCRRRLCEVGAEIRLGLEGDTIRGGDFAILH